jgi:hypothetical protein
MLACSVAAYAVEPDAGAAWTWLAFAVVSALALFVDTVRRFSAESTADESEAEAGAGPRR